MDELSHLGWVVHRAYELGGMLFGVRTNSPAFGAWLDEVLSDHRVKDAETDPNFSVLIGEGAKLGKRYHILYKESGHGVTALIAPELVPFFDQTPRKVEEAGLTLPITAFTAIDLDSGEAIPASRELDVGQDALDQLARIAPVNGRVVARGTLDRRTKVDLVCGMGYYREDPVIPISRGVGLFTLAANAKNLPVLRKAGLESLRRLVEGAQCCQLLAQGRKGMLDAFVSVVKGAGREALPTAT